MPAPLAVTDHRPAGILRSVEFGMRKIARDKEGRHDAEGSVDKRT